MSSTGDKRTLGAAVSCLCIGLLAVIALSIILGWFKIVGMVLCGIVAFIGLVCGIALFLSYAGVELD